jgi:hypothetical protein
MVECTFMAQRAPHLHRGDKCQLQISSRSHRKMQGVPELFKSQILQTLIKYLEKYLHLRY